MRKRIFWTGIIILVAGFLFNFLAGATLPGNVTIPLVYGSNQTGWLAVSFIGLIITIVGAIKKAGKKKR